MNLVRLAAALAVLVSHSFAMFRGEITGEPLSSLSPYTLGQHAVNGFFVLSGLMLSRSWELAPELKRFAIARTLRIYPALFVCGIVTVAVFWPLGSAADIRSSLDARAILYPIFILFEFSRAQLPDIFPTSAHYPGATNNPLWTIKYEIALYIFFALAAGLRLMSRAGFPAAFAILATLFVVAIDLFGGETRLAALAPIGRFVMSFALGVLAYRYKDSLPLTPVHLAALVLCATLSRGSVLEKPAFIVLTAYAVLYFGSLEIPRLSEWTRKADLSYGLYLYAWPVQQLLLFHTPSMGLAAHIVSSAGIAAAFAFASWHAVERPALDLKRWRSRRVMRHGYAPTS